MRFEPASSSSRLILTVLLALAFVMASLAETAHAVEASPVCLTDHPAETSVPTDDQQEPAHDHKAHHCGGCHLHVWQSTESRQFVFTAVNSRYRLLPDVAVLSSPLYELLRPPRA